MDVIHLLYIEGTDDIGDVDLLSYSWMCHELAHNLLFRYDAGLIAQFHPVLNRRANALHLSALSDQGSVKTQARQLVEEMVQVWSLSGDQRNWAHELAADLIALWTCGPAYLAAFQEAAEDSAVDPHRIDRSHPTYYARACALIEGARNLGWTVEADEVSSIGGSWLRPQWKEQTRNKSLALADRELVSECVRAAFCLCRALELPQCARPGMARLRELLDRGGTPDFGTELILAAWLVREQRGEELYEEWEGATLFELQRYIML